MLQFRDAALVITGLVVSACSAHVTAQTMMQSSNVYTINAGPSAAPYAPMPAAANEPATGSTAPPGMPVHNPGSSQDTFISPPDMSAFLATTFAEAGVGASIQPPCPDGAVAPDHFTPYMLGDFGNLIANFASDLKIAEGESPRPTDRVFFKFNFYDDVDHNRFELPTSDIQNVDLERYVFGFEKTFMDGEFSLGLRIPFNTITAQGKGYILTPTPPSIAIVKNTNERMLNGRYSLQLTKAGLVASPGDAGFTTTEFGNVSAIAKAILMEDKNTGSLISGGATVSFPTAQSPMVDPGQSTLTYLQPFVGFILNRGDFFLQGFSSITFPVAQIESVYMFNDVGAGYFVYRNAGSSGMIRSVAPTVELHVLTPLRQPESIADFGFVDDLQVPNVVDLTLGATVEFVKGATLGVGYVNPLTGPKPFEYEFIAQMNYRF